MKRVVITGLGPVSAIGIGVDEFTRNIFGLSPKILPIPPEYKQGYVFKSRFYSPFPEFSLKDFGLETRFEKIIQDEDKIAILATGLALWDAGFELEDELRVKNEELRMKNEEVKDKDKDEDEDYLNHGGHGEESKIKNEELRVKNEEVKDKDFLNYEGHEEKKEEKSETMAVCRIPENTGILLGMGLTGLEAALSSYLAHIMEKDAGDSINVLDGSIPNYNRMIIPRTMTNSIAAWSSILFGLTGPSFTVNASCASATIAIGEAFLKIRNGDCKMMVSGGVECLKEPFGSIMRGFDVLGALTGAEDGLPRPFSKNRSGFLFSDGGACALVLEDLEHAQARGARIYAELIDYKVNSDAYNIVQINPYGEKVTELLNELKRDRKIDYLNAHGTGTELNDKIESECIIKVFGDHDSQPVINSTKGILGHSIGVSGAFEAAVTAMSIKENKVHGNLIDDPMDNLNLTKGTVDLEINTAITTSYGFGGHNSGLIMKKYNG